MYKCSECFHGSVRKVEYAPWSNMMWKRFYGATRSVWCDFFFSRKVRVLKSYYCTQVPSIISLNWISQLMMARLGRLKDNYSEFEQQLHTWQLSVLSLCQFYIQIKFSGGVTLVWGEVTLGELTASRPNCTQVCTRHSKLFPLLCSVWVASSLRKQPFLLTLRRWGRFARRNVCVSLAEIPCWWRRSLFT